jgi:hypothetical protein
MEVEATVEESYVLTLKLSEEEAKALSDFLKMNAPANVYGSGDLGLDVARDLYYFLPSS